MWPATPRRWRPVLHVRCREGRVIVVIEPDVPDAFPTEAAVNDASRNSQYHSCCSPYRRATREALDVQRWPRASRPAKREARTPGRSPDVARVGLAVHHDVSPDEPELRFTVRVLHADVLCWSGSSRDHALAYSLTWPWLPPVVRVRPCSRARRRRSELSRPCSQGDHFRGRQVNRVEGPERFHWIRPSDSTENGIGHAYHRAPPFERRLRSLTLSLRSHDFARVQPPSSVSSRFSWSASRWPPRCSR